jgi:hypothetical protein
LLLAGALLLFYFSCPTQQFWLLALLWHHWCPSCVHISYCCRRGYVR